MICNFIAICLCATFTASFAHAEELSGIDQEALGKTTDLLKNRGEREKMKQSDAALKKVDRDVESLAGDGANKDAIYNMAAKVMEQMAKDSNGDAIKMQELIQQAQKNPQKFLESMDESNKAMIRGIANDIEKSNKVDSKQP